MSGDKMKTNGEAYETGWQGFPSLVLPVPERERRGLLALPVPIIHLKGAVAGGEEGVDSFLDNFSDS